MAEIRPGMEVMKGVRRGVVIFRDDPFNVMNDRVSVQWIGAGWEQSEFAKDLTIIPDTSF